MTSTPDRETVSLPTGAPVRRRSRLGDRVFRGTTVAMAVGLIALLALMLWVLGSGAADAFRQFGVRFLTGRNWNPTSGRQSFGAFAFIFGTIVTSAIALVLAGSGARGRGRLPQRDP